jgi:hypothetical protein
VYIQKAKWSLFAPKSSYIELIKILNDFENIIETLQLYACVGLYPYGELVLNSLLKDASTLEVLIKFRSNESTTSQYFNVKEFRDEIISAIKSHQISISLKRLELK